MVKRLQSLHSIGFVHQDLKPANIIIGDRNQNDFSTVYLIDMGLCIPYTMKNRLFRKPKSEEEHVSEGYAS